MENLGDIDLRGSLKWTFNILKIAGYWLPKNMPMSSAAFATFMVCFTMILYTCSEIVYLISVFGQLEEMANGLFLLLTHLAQIIKIVIFISKKQKIYCLLNNIQEDIFKPRNEHQLRHAMNTINAANYVAQIFIFLVIVTVSLWSLIPLLEETNTRKLPLRMWFPFDDQKSPLYEIAYVYQIFTVMLCGCANAAMDTIAATFVCQISVQIEILSDSFLYIKECAEEKLRNKREKCNEETSTSIEHISPELEVQMKFVMKKCVKHHLQIMR